MDPLREYQGRAIAGIRDSLLSGKRRPLLQLATGAGKTRIAAKIAEIVGLQLGRRVLFLAPRRELIEQAADTFTLQGLHPGIIMAGVAPRLILDLQVASFDTLHARAIRDRRMRLPPADLVIVDEAHLSIAKSRMEIIRHYVDSGARVIGLTATPARGDGRGLGEIYDDLVKGPSIPELVGEGHLVPLRYFAPSDPDLRGVKISMGDYVLNQLGEVMNQPKLIGDIVENWLRLAGGRHTVVFCTNVAHSIAVAAEFLAAGVAAEHLDGGTPTEERAAILDRVRSGETQVLCNVFVATYGLDIPRLDCAVLARPTRNITLYMQMLGRVMRPYDGKADALVIDHAGAVKRHGFAEEEIPWTLDSDIKVQEEKERIKQEKGEPKEVTCPECKHVYRPAPECPNCGHRFVRAGRGLAAVEADLVEIQVRARNEQAEKLDYISGLKWIAAERGYKPGYVGAVFKEKFGHWPDRHEVATTEASEPTRAVWRYLKHKQIQYAKSRSRAA